MELITKASPALSGESRVPGDKSISHRAAILAGLAEGRSTLRGFSSGDDNQRTLLAMQRMGVAMNAQKNELWVDGVGLAGLVPTSEIDCGNSGTSMRLLAGVCATIPARTVLTGDASLRQRPMKRIQEPLERMGARVRGRSMDNELCPPLEITGGTLAGITVALSIASAQVKSAILLAALRASGVTRITEPGRSRDHTERLLRVQGAPISLGDAVVLDPTGWNGRLAPLDLTIPGDLSSAAFLLVAALLLPGSDLVVRDVLLNPTRTGVLDALWAMGAQIEVHNLHDCSGEPVGDLHVRSSSLKACELSGDLVLRAIDEVPILAVAATQAQGDTVIRNAQELRRKESDRLSAIARTLGKMGCDVTELPDGLVIHGPCLLLGATFGPEDILLDHRIAMSLAVAGLCARNPVHLQKEAAETIGSSFPTFVQTLSQLGARCEVR